MKPNDHALARLTEPQRECLRLVMSGYKSKEIAHELGIGVDAVNKRLAGAKSVLGTTSRFAAARQLAAWEAAQPSHSLVGQTLAVEQEAVVIDVVHHTAVEDIPDAAPALRYAAHETRSVYGFADAPPNPYRTSRFDWAALVATPIRTFALCLCVGVLLALLIRF